MPDFDAYISQPVPDAVDGKRAVYAAIASAFQARLNCEQNGNIDWQVAHGDRINRLVDWYLPRGAGFDSGTTFDYEASTPQRLVFQTSFHHMNDGGYYDGWTEHTVIVTPTFDGVNVRVTGRDRNDIKDYIADLFT